jgi:hypothetical protein
MTSYIIATKNPRYISCIDVVVFIFICPHRHKYLEAFKITGHIYILSLNLLATGALPKRDYSCLSVTNWQAVAKHVISHASSIPL